MKTVSKSTFQKKLLSWFDQHGRKTLPWQINKTPYRVWVSEIMLQQTQVKTVIPYYEQFMQRFPDVAALATAHEDEVLHHWAGLGYYSRARNLHKAAKMIYANNGAQFPDDLTLLQALPGIGRSTAGAIRSIAFKLPTPILDGNVKRVLSRLFGVHTDINDKKTTDALWMLAENLTPTSRCDDHTQAIMDLGATFCTRSQPKCEMCPFNKHCIAHLSDLTDSLPFKGTKKPLPEKEATFLIIKENNAYLLEKRPAKGIWGGLWCFPQLDNQANRNEINAYCQKQWGTSLKSIKNHPPFRHTFTHYRLQINPAIIQLEKRIGDVIPNTFRWVSAKEPRTIGLPKPIQTILGSLT